MTSTALASADDSLPAATGEPTRLVTGLTASGRLHIGNYVGAVRPLLDLAASGTTQAVCFVADLHAMTMDHDPGRLRERTRELAATLLACGLGDDATLFLQSAVPAHTELAYLLECTAAYGEMTRMIQFKEKAGRERSAARLSLLTYPALMAADILLYRADVVPVGEDQRQHLELTRTLARRFNARYGEVFTVPSAAVPPAAARLRDLRVPSAKMGKSASGAGSGGGVVHLLDDPVRIAATVRAAVTDLDPVLSYDPELRPGVANLAELLGALTGRAPAAALTGLRGGGALKAAVTQALVETLRPVRRRYAEITADPGELDRRLAAGAATATELAAPTLAAARNAVGLLPRP
jgi:tryptophanyl-tRNA synthetase